MNLYYNYSNINYCDFYGCGVVLTPLNSTYNYSYDKNFNTWWGSAIAGKNNYIQEFYNITNITTFFTQYYFKILAFFDPQSSCNNYVDFKLYDYNIANWVTISHNINVNSITNFNITYKLNNSFVNNGILQIQLAFDNCGDFGTNWLNVTEQFIYINSTNFYTTLIKSCEVVFPNSTFGYEYSTVSCQTDNIDTRDCSSINWVQSKYKVSFWNTLFENDSYGVCNYGKYLFNATQIFNTTNTKQTYTNIPACLYNNTNLVFYETNTPSNLLNYNNTNSFATCYYDYNNLNLTLAKLKCDLEITCSIDISSLNQNCSSLCVNGYLYENGTWIDDLAICSNFQKVTACQNGCGSLTSCYIPTILIPNQTTSIIPINTTSTQAQQFLSIFFSPIGFLFYFFLITQLGIYWLSNEFFTIIYYGIVNFSLGILGLFPSWIGILSSYTAFLVCILAYDRLSD